jgi:U3 small nucleolar RNA-associated protein 21
LEPKFLVEKEKQDSDGSRILHFADMTSDTPFTRKLEEATAGDSFAAFFDQVKAMSPAAFDLEIRTLDPRDDFHLLRLFLRAIGVQMQTNRDFELLQSYLAVVMKIHGDVFLNHADLFREELQRLLELQRETWSKVETLFQRSLCMVDFVRNV